MVSNYNITESIVMVMHNESVRVDTRTENVYEQSCKFWVFFENLHNHFAMPNCLFEVNYLQVTTALVPNEKTVSAFGQFFSDIANWNADFWPNLNQSV